MVRSTISFRTEKKSPSKSPFESFQVHHAIRALKVASHVLARSNSSRLGKLSSLHGEGWCLCTIHHIGSILVVIVYLSNSAFIRAKASRELNATCGLPLALLGTSRHSRIGMTTQVTSPSLPLIWQGERVSTSEIVISSLVSALHASTR